MQNKAIILGCPRSSIYLYGTMVEDNPDPESDIYMWWLDLSEEVLTHFANKLRDEKFIPWLKRQDEGTRYTIYGISFVFSVLMFAWGLEEINDHRKAVPLVVMGGMSTLCWLAVFISYKIAPEWTKNELPIFVAKAIVVIGIIFELAYLSAAVGMIGYGYYHGSEVIFIGILMLIGYSWALAAAWRHSKLNPIIRHCPICTCTLLEGETVCAFCTKMAEKPEN